ncbi:hypothetical protein M1L60_24885 [Actinoplanes sp. TRM 88003]|uniref:NADH:flavin oxidoreductase/NADH oxidase N-terminal domain-containing protein n=1 Tax=Paractinoplanes aksuensis TaxID=2939490 RepID=A0ABT1DSL8_9ACTN|nr:hypothetical protein [Actinoplanes aksuensis]MCO8273837.1 hypothetical protein [Actinoplanes aksuensis]
MSVQDLFEPLTLLHGPAMRNRFMLAPLVNQQSDHDGSASEYDLDWMSQVARGGYALVQTGATTVEAGGIAYERQLGIHSDAHEPGRAYAWWWENHERAAGRADDRRGL